jgi:hypothetical protein
MKLLFKPSDLTQLIFNGGNKGENRRSRKQSTVEEIKKQGSKEFPHAQANEGPSPTGRTSTFSENPPPARNKKYRCKIKSIDE